MRKTDSPRRGWLLAAVSLLAAPAVTAQEELPAGLAYLRLLFLVAAPLAVVALQVTAVDLATRWTRLARNFWNAFVVVLLVWVLGGLVTALVWFLDLEMALGVTAVGLGVVAAMGASTLAIQRFYLAGFPRALATAAIAWVLMAVFSAAAGGAAVLAWRTFFTPS